MAFGLLSPRANARERWTELNLGPFYLDTRSDLGTARDTLTQLEQVRWVLGGLLEIQDLRALWPLRVVYDAKVGGTGQFIERNGQYLLVCAPGTHPSVAQVAQIFLDANTPRLPPEAEFGLLALFSTLEAHGSHVSWGGPVPHPDLAWARMQLFATRFEYRASLHVLVTSLKNGSSLRVAERNAFGKAPDVLEKEAQANLAQGNWTATPVSGRPLDPKRDFGEHLIDAEIVDCYRADALLASDPKAAEALYKAAIQAGGAAKGLGYAGLAEVARQAREDVKPFLDSALTAGLISAPLDVALAEEETPARAIPLLKSAASLNSSWAVPVYQQAQLAKDPAQKETLLRQAAQIDRRQTSYWVELARLETANGHAIEAQGSWLRAEDSALTEEEKERIRQERQKTEQERLDVADAERVRQREAVHQEDRRAQDDAAAAIRAAEEKANRANDEAAGGTKPDVVVPWDATLPSHKFSGLLTQVDCLRGGKTRLLLRDRGGKTLVLSGQASTGAELACGAQQPPRRVTLSYVVDQDSRLGTSGRIVHLDLQ